MAGAGLGGRPDFAVLACRAAQGSSRADARKRNAYKCYSTPEEIEAMREKARAEGRPPRYDGTWRDRDPSEAPEGIDPVVRLRAPEEGETVIEDRVQGRVVIPNKGSRRSYPAALRRTPTYMLAVVVDDHDMGVTHIIRGVDHLTNAARQTLIFKALGWKRRKWHTFRSFTDRMAQNCRNGTVRRVLKPIAPWATCRRPCGTTSPGSDGARR